MLISVTCSSEYHLAYDACPFKQLIMFIYNQNLLSAKAAYYLIIIQLHYPHHGLFASTFKVLIGLPLVISLTRYERTGYGEDVGTLILSHRNPAYNTLHPFAISRTVIPTSATLP